MTFCSKSSPQLSAMLQVLTDMILAGGSHWQPQTIMKVCQPYGRICDRA